MATEKNIYYELSLMAMNDGKSGIKNVPAIRIVQRSFPYLSDSHEQMETEIYVTALPLKYLEKADIDRKTPENPEGYQREPNEARINNEMVKYLTGEIGSYPTSVLLNVRGSVEFEVKEEFNGIEFGYLTIPESAKLIIIDGQHRIYSLITAKRLISKISDDWAKEIENYPLPVSILKVDRMMEMVHFYIVNSRQKSVPTDLAFELLRDMVYKKALPDNVAKAIRSVVKPSEIWKAKATQIANIVNENDDSENGGRLQRFGEDKGDVHITMIKSFAESLKYIVKDRVFANMADEILAQLIIDYWSAIYELYKEAFIEPSKYTITSYTGLHAFHMLFPFVYSVSIIKFGGSVTKDTMKKILSYLKTETPDHPDSEFRDPIDISKWEKATTSLIFTVTNARGVKTLAENLRIKIELAMKSEELQN